METSGKRIRSTTAGQGQREGGRERGRADEYTFINTSGAGFGNFADYGRPRRRRQAPWGLVHTPATRELSTFVNAEKYLEYLVSLRIRQCVPGSS